MTVHQIHERETSHIPEYRQGIITQSWWVGHLTEVYFNAFLFFSSMSFVLANDIARKSEIIFNESRTKEKARPSYLKLVGK